MKQFHCGTRIISGPGSLSCLTQMQIGALLIVTDPFFEKNGTAQRIASLAGGARTEIFSQVAPDPSVALAAQGTKHMLDFRPDTVLALGGGSAMDCAKAMVYFSGLQVHFIAVPTTSGSGSEVTDFSILTHDGVKHPLVDPKLQPDTAILDSELLTSLPPGLIADTGFDLISHAMESWVALGAGPVSDALAGDALRLALHALPRSFQGDGSLRDDVHIAATMAGMAFSSAGLGLCHAIAHALGGQFHLSHGKLNAILLPAVMDVNSEKALRRYGQLTRRLGLSTGADIIAFRALKTTLLRMRRQLSLPETLAQAGIPPADVRERMETIVTAALADPCCATNPLPPQAHHIQRILCEVMGRD